jgi:hypothetical protein
MLNTKPIRKKVFDEMENIDFKSKLGIDDNINKKNLETNDSISSKEIIKLHNKNLTAEKENTKMMEDIVNRREINTFIVNARGGNRDGQQLENQVKNQVENQVENQVYQNNKIDIHDDNTMHIQNNKLIRELATQLKNELKPIPQVNTDNLMDNLTNKGNNKLAYAEWNEDKNSYVMYNNNEIEGFYTNNDIIKSIIQGNNVNKYIKQYFFIISYNKEIDTNEFNFIDSIFTNNLELMIKTQNSLFDLSNQSELFEENEEYSNNLLIFNYQFIIYLFKKSNYYNNIESNKIAKFYSTITYRFTTLVLKQIMKIEDVNITLSNDIMKLIDIKNDISSQLTNIESHLDNSDNMSIKNKNNKKNNKNKNKSNNLINIINTTTENTNEEDEENEDDEDDEDEDENNNMDVRIKNNIKNKYNINIESNTDNNNNLQISETSEENNLSSIKNKSGSKTKSILDEIISSLSNKNKQNSNYDSEDNDYKEINDDVSSYKDKQITGSMNSTNNSTTSNNNINEIDKNKIHYKIANKNVSITDPSYNKNSAINNGKIYKIKL